MNFQQWIYIILSVLVAASAHRAGIMLLAHTLNVRFHAIQQDSKPDIMGQLAALLPMALEATQTKVEVHAQENSEQSASSSQTSPKESDGSQSKG